MKLFADDNSIHIEFIKPKTASNTLNTDLKEIQKWADQWLVDFSTHKTKLLTCSNKKKAYPLIQFNDTQIESVRNHILCLIYQA